MIFVFLFFFHQTLSYRNMTLFGNSTLGYYYLEAYVGTPPQKKALIMDTGSHMTIFPCKGCTVCRKHLTNIFNPKVSNTFEWARPHKNYFHWKCNSNQTKKCSFNQAYTEGSSYSGYYAIDNFLFENELEHDKKKYTHVFGCADKETGEFYNQEVDGIIGFGVTRTTENAPPTILDIEKQEKRISNLIFSICIAKNGGELSFGDWNKYLHIPNQKKQFIDTKNSDWSKQYKVPLTAIEINGKKILYNYNLINENGGKAFFDSGTTFVYFDAHLMHKFKFAITNFCQQGSKNCAGKNNYEECYHWNKKLFKSKKEMMKTFPRISFEFEDVKMDWFPQDYFVTPIDGDNHLCIGVKSLKNVILGAVLMRNYDIYFDRSNKKVGFVRANCGRIDNFLDNYPEDHFQNNNNKKIKKSIKKKKKIKSKKKILSKIQKIIQKIKVSKSPTPKIVVQTDYEKQVQIENQDLKELRQKYMIIFISLFFLIIFAFAIKCLLYCKNELGFDTKSQIQKIKESFNKNKQLIQLNI